MSYPPYEMTLKNRIFSRLLEIEKKNLQRRLCPPQGIDFSSNDYLGLSQDKRIVEAMIRGINFEGVGSTGSRLLRGERHCFAELERQFAEWKQTDSSIYFSSGYQANIGVMHTFLEEGDIVFSDELNHASLIDGIRLTKCQKIVFRHLDLEQLKTFLSKAKGSGEKFLVTESLFSMDGDFAPLKKYAEICAETNTHMIVDEAHAVGIFGKDGSGLIEETGIENQVFLSINTAGKALAVSGAFVAGDKWAIDYLIQRARSFIFTTAPVPAVAHALKTAIDIIRSEPKRRDDLLELSGFLRNNLNNYGIDVSMNNSQIIPIIIGDNERAVKIANSLQAKGFDLRAIRPPTVPINTSRLRISLNALLTQELLESFVKDLCFEIKNI